MNNGTFSESDWQAELDSEIDAQMSGKRHHLCFVPCPKQAYYIVKARDAGVEWDTIMKYCRAQGWPGSESTMLRFYRQKKGK